MHHEPVWASWSMNDVERFVARENVCRFIDRLADETDSGKRAIVMRLLLDEEDRFAKAAGNLDAVNNWIQICDAHIARITALMKDFVRPSADLSERDRLLQVMVAIKGGLVSVRRTMVSRLDLAAALQAETEGSGSGYHKRPNNPAGSGGAMSEKQSLRDEYLAKAVEADEAAAKARDPDQKESWKKMAEIYRNLASRIK